MAELGAFFGNPNIQRQGARARALASQRDVNTLPDPLTYAVMQGLLGTRPDEMGFSVLNPDYKKIKKVAEPAFALGLLGQAAPVLAPLTKGLPVGASVKNVGGDLLSYRGSHTAPSRDFGAPLHDLTGGGQMYPADVYSSKAAQFYGGNLPYDQKAFSIAQQYKDKPDALVTIYRAVPKDISNSEKLATLEKQMAAYMKRGTLPKDADNYSSGSKWYDAAYEKREQLRKMPDEPSNDINAINAGDWVTLTKEYAKDHGESALKGEYKILSKKVKAKEVFTNADSIHEFGYQPQVTKPIQAVAPQQEALDTAQKNAALPIEEGGLGLPKDNTPEMRAAVMFPTDLLHGTAKDFPSFDLSKAGTNTRQAGDELGIFSTSKPFLANDYALIASRGGWANRTDPENAVVYPLVGSFKNPKKYQTASEFYRDADAMAAEQKLGQWREQLQKEGYDSVFVRPDLEEVVAFNPDQLRSRFAAFDPFRRDTETALQRGVAPPDLLAGVLPLGLLTDEDQRKKLYEMLPSLLGQ